MSTPAQSAEFKTKAGSTLPGFSQDSLLRMRSRESWEKPGNVLPALVLNSADCAGVDIIDSQRKALLLQ